MIWFYFKSLASCFYLGLYNDYMIIVFFLYCKYIHFEQVNATPNIETPVYSLL